MHYNKQKYIEIRWIIFSEVFRGGVKAKQVVMKGKLAKVAKAAAPLFTCAYDLVKGNGIFCPF